jgi:hypothetical protein
MHRTATLLAAGIVAWIAACFAALAATPSARAADLCVAPHAGCAPAQTFAGVQDALAAAHDAPGADRVLLGAATYTAPTTSGFTYVGAGDVEVVGLGPGQTVLTSPAGADRVLTLLPAGAKAKVRALRAVIPASTPLSGMGIELAGDVEDVEVVRLAPQTQPGTGISLHGGTVSGTSVDLSAGKHNADHGYALRDAPGTVRDSTAVATSGVSVFPGGPATVERMRITALGGSGVQAVGGEVTARNTLIVSEGATGLNAEATGDGDATVTADHLTVVGNGNGIGILASTIFGPAFDAAVTLRHSVLHGLDRSLVRVASGAGAGTITTVGSDYDASAGAIQENGPGSVTQSGQRFSPDPGFAGGDDFRLTASSPLVDAAETGTTAASGTTDVDGDPRAIDGDADCDARRDIGAYERQVGTLVAVAKGIAAPAGSASTFSAAGSCHPDPAKTVGFAWSFDDGGTAVGETVGHVFQTPGQHKATLTVSAVGAADATAEVVLEIPAAGGPGGGDGAGGGGAAAGDGGGAGATAPPFAGPDGPGATARPAAGSARDRTAPRITRLSVRRLRGRRARVRFVLSEAATVTVRAGGRTRRLRRRAGTVTLTVRLGRGRVVVTAVDAAGDRTRRTARPRR